MYLVGAKSTEEKLMRLFKHSGLAVIAICVLISCETLSPLEVAFQEKSWVADRVAFCSFENLTYEDTGEYAERSRFWSDNWHITQCAGRDQ